LIYRYISVKKRQNLNNYIPDKNIGNDTFNSTVKPLISDSGKMDFLGDNRDLLGVRCPPFALQAPEGRQVSGIGKEKETIMNEIGELSLELEEKLMRQLSLKGSRFDL
jgi:hypothetical protein